MLTVSAATSANISLNKVEPNISTSLDYPCQEGYTKIVQLLVENGADVNYSAYRGFTPIRITARNGHLELVQETIDYQHKLSEIYIQSTKKSENDTYEAYKIAAYLLQKNNEYKNKYRERETTNSENTGAV